MFTTPFTQGSLILLLFQSFEVASACFLIFFQTVSPFSKRIKPKVADTFSATAEGIAQRNKLSLHSQNSSGITHVRKTHLKRCEVVMGNQLSSYIVPLSRIVESI